MNNVSFLKQWGKKYGIGIIVGLLMSVGFLVMDADRWIEHFGQYGKYVDTHKENIQVIVFEVTAYTSS